MNLFKKLFHLPSPKELGWAESNALGSRLLTPYQEGKTWEDWTDLMKKDYPIAYYLRHTLPDFFVPLEIFYKNTVYWFQNKLRPGKYNYYKINLAGVDPLNPSKYGFLDPTETMKLAVWYALCQHVEKGSPEDPRNQEVSFFLDANDKAEKIEIYDEIMYLYKWWKVDQISEYDDYNYKLKKLREARLKGVDSVLSAEDRILLYNSFENRQEEMFLRACKLRVYLWS